MADNNKFRYPRNGIIAKMTVAVLMGFLSGAFTTGLYIGTTKQSLHDHINNKDLHENAQTRRDRVDDRIILYLAPVKVQLDRMEAKIDVVEKRVLHMEKGR